MNPPAPGKPTSPEPRIVRVDLGERAYDVVVGRNLLGEVIGLQMNRCGIPKRSAIIIDCALLGRVDLSFFDSEHVEGAVCAAESGESGKSLDQYGNLLRWLAKKKCTRSDTIVAIGGGVIGDLAGFVAATYLRGIAFVQVPTTLLAMVDSSVGGKTGVNLPEGKNLVGAFYQPRLVIADLNTLGTLPLKEFAAGMAEVIKYGAIADRALFDRVAIGVKPTDSDLADIVARCVEIKARIVEQDEFETKGLRALLNFGHTIGHAIEKATGYTKYLHGEAISIGMRAAAWLSVWQAGLPEADARRIEAALLANHLPIQLDPAVTMDSILAGLGNDKKVAADGQNRWVLLKTLGEASSGWELPRDLVERSIKMLY